MKVSLILATVGGRLDELETFLGHLDRQAYRDFELIVVDQSGDDRLMPLLRKFQTRFRILHVRSEIGISRARNAGLRCAAGDVLAFPDDDCWYDPDVLSRAMHFFRRHPAIHGLTGRTLDEDGHESVAKYDSAPGFVDKRNVWRRAVSVTIFLRKSAAVAIGGFDEEIGAGAGTIFGSGEETDYVLRALENHRLYYDPAFIVRHPDPLSRHPERVARRAYHYGCGFGKVVAKHRYPAWFKLGALLRPFAGMLLTGGALQFTKSMYYWSSFKGRLRGMQ